LPPFPIAIGKGGKSPGWFGGLPACPAYRQAGGRQGGQKNRWFGGLGAKVHRDLTEFPRDFFISVFGIF